ncbi:hypothetical protein JYU34_015071 [Plutella xylostella]|uniref:Uncharacterized protein n=1 Tax=Plutella xylostella TaxID=51655 RepID=A0ABQ7Q673_PLUXY|nr:hypothetical protein JYU34_015071 [Plutella xylostella]
MYKYPDRSQSVHSHTELVLHPCLHSSTSRTIIGNPWKADFEPPTNHPRFYGFTVVVSSDHEISTTGNGIQKERRQTSVQPLT